MFKKMVKFVFALILVLSFFGLISCSGLTETGNPGDSTIKGPNNITGDDGENGGRADQPLGVHLSDMSAYDNAAYNVHIIYSSIWSVQKQGDDYVAFINTKNDKIKLLFKVENPFSSKKK